MEDVANPYRLDTPLGGESTVEEVVPTQDKEDVPHGTPERGTPETPPETPETPQETDPTDPKEGKHYSRAELRSQLTTSQEELTKLRLEGQMRTQQYTDALAKQEELTREIKQRDESYVKDRTPVYDPSQDPEVSKPRAEAYELFIGAAAEMSPENAEIFEKDLQKQIIPFYADALSRGASALRAAREKLTEIFGEDGPKVYDAVKQIFPKVKVANEAESKNSITYFDRTREGYEKRRRSTIDDFSKIGKWTEDQIKANPDDPDAVISAAIGGNEEITKNLEVLLHKAATQSVGPPPLPPKATPEQVAQHRQQERDHHQFLQTAYRSKVQVKALTAVVKHLLDERNALLKRVTSASPANRADITPEGGKPAEKTTVPQGGDFSDIQNPYRGA
jgi:hypothetical protein